MKKIIIVGHPTSGYEQIQQYLQTHGMVFAEPSRRQQLRPADINAALCQAHDCEPLHSLGDDERLKSLSPAPVWAELALDLMLANVSHKLWGWADPQAVHLLDYWAGLEPGIHFVLVYAAPATAFLKPAPISDPLEAESSASKDLDIDRIQQEWVAFNHSLLYFYLRHPQRSILVHIGGDGVTDLGQLLQLPTPAQGNAALSWPIDNSRQSLVERILCKQLAEKYPAMQQAYDELQAVATVPFLAQNKQIDASEIAQALQEIQSGQYGNQNQPGCNLNHDDLIEENELLLNQLHLVQEELESYYLKYQELKKQNHQSVQKKSSKLKIEKTAPAKGFLSKAQAHIKAKIHARKIAQSDLFDAQWYLRQNPDIAKSKLFSQNPALHYLLHGGYEGRDPSPQFSNWKYLNRNNDIYRAGFNPLLHYICHGKDEGRPMS